MKKNFNVFCQIFIGCLVVCLLVIGLAYLLKNCQKAADAKEVKNIATVKNAPVQHYTDAAGDDHATKPVAIGDYDALLRFYESVIDSQAKLLNIQANKIQSLTQATAETKGSIGNGIASDYDSVWQPCPERIDWKDKWSVISALKLDTGWLLRYQLNDTITTVTYWKKVGLFKKALFVDIKTQNPNVRFAGIQSLQVAGPKPKKWGLGINVSYTYYEGKWRPVVGVGLQYNLFRF